MNQEWTADSSKSIDYAIVFNSHAVDKRGLTLGLNFRHSLIVIVQCNGVGHMWFCIESVTYNTLFNKIYGMISSDA